MALRLLLSVQKYYGGGIPWMYYLRDSVRL